MSQETLNIIIGALIGFIPSSILALVTLRFQMYQKERERKWLLQDQDRIRLREIRENRLKQIEFIGNELYKWTSNVSKDYMYVFRDSKSYLKFVDEMSKLDEFNLALSGAFALQNPAFEKTLDEMLDTIKSIRKTIRETREKFNEKFSNDHELMELELEDKLGKERSRFYQLLVQLNILCDEYRQKYL